MTTTELLEKCSRVVKLEEPSGIDTSHPLLSEALLKINEAKEKAERAYSYARFQ